MRNYAVAIFIVLFVGFLFATSTQQLTRVKAAISSFCTDLTSILPVASMLMVVVGSVVYAAGQIMGAETRARANVWATAALTGAVMAMLINSVTPPILSSIYGKEVNCSGTASPTPPSNNCGTINCGTGQKCCSSGNNYWCCPSTTNCGTTLNSCTVPASGP